MFIFYLFLSFFFFFLKHTLLSSVSSTLDGQVETADIPTNEHMSVLSSILAHPKLEAVQQVSALLSARARERESVRARGSESVGKHAYVSKR